MYCVLSINGVSASFTMVPAGSSEGVHTLRFRVKDSVFLRAFNTAVTEAQEENGVDARGEDKLFKLDLNEVSFAIHGPYCSTDLGIRSAKKLIVLLAPNAATVGESVLYFDVSACVRCTSTRR